MNFDKILFRASSLGDLATEPKLKADKDAGNLSETAKAKLIEVYVREKYGIEKNITTKYFEKGLMVEEDSITLYSRVKRLFFQKNEQNLRNAYISGTPDLFIGDSVEKAEEIIDIKSSWDIYSFYATQVKPLDKGYYWQLQAYMALTGARKAKLVYCLVNTPETLINDEKRKLMYKMNVISDMDEDYQKAAEELEMSMTYDHIPLNERIYEIEVLYNQSSIDQIYAKIEKARQFLNEFETR